MEEVIDNGAGDHARPTGEGFAFHAPFVGPDRDMSGGGFLYKVGICALGKIVVVADGGAYPCYVAIDEVIDKGKGVGNSGIENVNGAFQSFDRHTTIQFEVERV